MGATIVLQGNHDINNGTRTASDQLRIYYPDGDGGTTYADASHTGYPTKWESAFTLADSLTSELGSQGGSGVFITFELDSTNHSDSGDFSKLTNNDSVEIDDISAGGTIDTGTIEFEIPRPSVSITSPYPTSIDPYSTTDVTNAFALSYTYEITDGYGNVCGESGDLADECVLSWFYDADTNGYPYITPGSSETIHQFLYDPANITDNHQQYLLYLVRARASASGAPGSYNDDLSGTVSSWVDVWVKVLNESWIPNVSGCSDPTALNYYCLTDQLGGISADFGDDSYCFSSCDYAQGEEGEGTECTGAEANIFVDGDPGSGFTDDSNSTICSYRPGANFSLTNPDSTLQVNFTDQSTDLDGNETIAQWAWSFGDGNAVQIIKAGSLITVIDGEEPGATPVLGENIFINTPVTNGNVNYIYNEPGQYIVALQVTDEDGNSDITTQTIQVDLVGCTDEFADNYEPKANIENNTCVYYGCKYDNVNVTNYFCDEYPNSYPCLQTQGYTLVANVIDNTNSCTFNSALDNEAWLEGFLTDTASEITGAHLDDWLSTNYTSTELVGYLGHDSKTLYEILKANGTDTGGVDNLDEYLMTTGAGTPNYTTTGQVQTDLPTLTTTYFGTSWLNSTCLPANIFQSESDCSVGANLGICEDNYTSNGELTLANNLEQVCKEHGQILDWCTDLSYTPVVRDCQLVNACNVNVNATHSCNYETHAAECITNGWTQGDIEPPIPTYFEEFAFNNDNILNASEFSYWTTNGRPDIALMVQDFINSGNATPSDAYWLSLGEPPPGYVMRTTDDFIGDYGWTNPLTGDQSYDIEHTNNCCCTFTTTYYEDADNDGLGCPDVTHEFCPDEDTTGWVTDNSDGNCDCDADTYSTDQCGHCYSNDVDPPNVCFGCVALYANNTDVSAEFDCDGSHTTLDCLSGTCTDSQYNNDPYACGIAGETYTYLNFYSETTHPATTIDPNACNISCCLFETDNPGWLERIYDSESFSFTYVDTSGAIISSSGDLEDWLLTAHGLTTSAEYDLETSLPDLRQWYIDNLYTKTWCKSYYPDLVDRVYGCMHASFCDYSPSTYNSACLFEEREVVNTLCQANGWTFDGNYYHAPAGHPLADQDLSLDQTANCCCTTQAATWYLDDDGDGLGCESITESHCHQPAANYYLLDSFQCEDVMPYQTGPMVSTWCNVYFESYTSLTGTETTCDCDGENYFIDDCGVCRGPNDDESNTTCSGCMDPLAYDTDLNAIFDCTKNIPGVCDGGLGDDTDVGTCDGGIYDGSSCDISSDCYDTSCCQYIDPGADNMAWLGYAFIGEDAETNPFSITWTTGTPGTGDVDAWILANYNENEILTYLDNTITTICDEDYCEETHDLTNKTYGCLDETKCGYEPETATHPCSLADATYYEVCNNNGYYFMDSGDLYFYGPGDEYLGLNDFSLSNNCCCGVTIPEWYLDDDEDGFGCNTMPTISSCTNPSTDNSLYITNDELPEDVESETWNGTEDVCECPGDGVEPDECGICGGDNSSCTGCTDVTALNTNQNGDGDYVTLVFDCLSNNINDDGYVQDEGWNSCCAYSSCGCDDVDVQNCCTEDIDSGELTCEDVHCSSVPDVPAKKLYSPVTGPPWFANKNYVAYTLPYEITIESIENMFYTTEPLTYNDWLDSDDDSENYDIYLRDNPYRTTISSGTTISSYDDYDDTGSTRLIIATYITGMGWIKNDFDYLKPGMGIIIQNTGILPTYIKFREIIADE